MTAPDPAIELAARARAGALLAKAGHVGYGRRLVSRHLREDVARAGERLAYLERRGQLDELGRAALVAVVDLADAIGARAYLDNMIAKDIASVERRFGLPQEPRP